MFRIRARIISSENVHINSKEFKMKTKSDLALKILNFSQFPVVTQAVLVLLIDDS